jgi:hypothetical protein
MMRFIIVLLQVLSLLFLNTIFGGDISIHLNVPEQINAGTEIKVEITLDKGKLSGFSRFQMELPNGLTATNIQSANADFSFKDQKVRLIWLRMPEDETITVAFSIKCDDRLKGNFDLTGKLSYIDNNERKSIDIQPKTLTIVPNPGIDPNLLVDIKDFGKSIYQAYGPSSGQIACVRQKPGTLNKNEYIVTLLVNKESLKKYAKIEEIIPKGFTAININSKDGIFAFKDNKVKYLWMNLPADPYFTVSYKLITANKETTPLITGTFSYMDDNNTLSVPILEKDVDLAKLTPEMVKTILQAPTSLVAITGPSKDNNIKTDSSKQTIQNQVAANNLKTIGIQPGTKQTNQLNTTVPTDNTHLLAPQSVGISYRVQIAAGHKPINIKRYFNKYKLENSVVKEQHDGWIKYSLGGFTVYKDARDYRTHIWNTTPITDAFVSAYNEGKRITVQEALMIANQKWYK